MNYGKYLLIFFVVIGIAIGYLLYTTKQTGIEKIKIAQASIEKLQTDSIIKAEYAGGENYFIISSFHIDDASTWLGGSAFIKFTEYKTIDGKVAPGELESQLNDWSIHFELNYADWEVKLIRSQKDIYSTPIFPDPKWENVPSFIRKAFGR